MLLRRRWAVARPGAASLPGEHAAERRCRRQPVRPRRWSRPRPRRVPPRSLAPKSAAGALFDTTVSTALFTLPTSAIAHIPGAPGPISLPQRTLLRHVTWSLPSGQAIARRLHAPVLHRRDLADFAPFDVGLDTSTPLWLYVLREAQLANDGQYLGPVGGRIVAKVMLGLLRADPASYLSAQPDWQPHLGASGSSYQIADLLRYAGVDPASRDQ